MIKDPVFHIDQNNRVLVRVKVNSPQTTIVEASDRLIRIDIAAKPEANKANIELIKYLRRITKKSCRIISGSTRKLKIVEFE